MSEMIYYIPPDKHSEDDLRRLLEDHPEIQFVSLMGIDIGGNSTDEKIPIKILLEDMNAFLSNGIQTDGSSVVLHEIATLNNARVDLLPDLDVNWFVDYNYDNYREEDNLPVGTLKIPAFLIHNNKRIDSRSILIRAKEYLSQKLKETLRSHPNLLKSVEIESIDEIDEIVFTAATELELWVRTPDDRADIEKLSTSQALKEQYWKRTQGTVRSALENAINIMDKYGLEPEMGHKEVGGVTSKIGTNGQLVYVMEQLEIDWKYSSTLQAADNEMIVRELVGDIFRMHGLEVTFAAKPLEGVAGSGEHVHIGIAARLKNGKVRNLFSPKHMEKNYLSEVGYGALMGILKNYEVLNPFIASSNDAFNRLKPGFEAPVCIVASLGANLVTPTRNRSVLVGAIRDMTNSLATRFEVRSPNPLSNTYLVLASLYQAMIDGITAVAASEKNIDEIEKELFKTPEEEGLYLEKGRAYVSEEDVFDFYTKEERDRNFGIPPATVWENLNNLEKYKDKKAVLLEGGVFTDDIIRSFEFSSLDKWATELKNRILMENTRIIRDCKQLHNNDHTTDLDIVMWEKISNLRIYLMKDSLERKSLFTKIREALDNEDYSQASKLQLEMSSKMKELKELYLKYKRNLFEVEE